MLNNSIFLNDDAWKNKWNKLIKEKENKKQCKRCLYDEDTPAISFDGEGICNYCRNQEELEKQFPGGEIGREQLENIAQKIKKEGKNKKYDVVVGVSGGCDSSYLLHLAKELGLRPLAVHFDNTWDSTIAVENIHNVLKALDVELWTYVVNNEEYDDLYLSMLKSGTPDLDTPSDIALATTLNMAASKYGVRYIFEGHSFRSEGLAPLGWVYMDAKYIYNVQKQFGKRKLKTFPYLWFSKQLKWMLLNRIKKIRPLWYIDYNKKNTKELLSEKYGWQWYGGHHLENRICAFTHTFFLPRRFGLDLRALGYSALIRSEQLSREKGWKMLKEPPDSNPEIVDIFKKRLKLSDQQFHDLMSATIKSYRDYETYKPTFERWRPFFYLMAKMELIPWSFYIKYTSKDNI